MKGDVILKVDGEAVGGKAGGADEAAEILRGKEGTPITLTVRVPFLCCLLDLQCCVRICGERRYGKAQRADWACRATLYRGECP